MYIQRCAGFVYKVVTLTSHDIILKVLYLILTCCSNKIANDPMECKTLSGQVHCFKELSIYTRGTSIGWIGGDSGTRLYTKTTPFRKNEGRFDIQRSDRNSILFSGR